MATIRQLFGQYNIGNGRELDVYFTYDDVTGAVASFDWDNPGPPTGLVITVNGVPSARTIPSGPDVWNPPGQVTMVREPKHNNWIFPFSVSVAPA